MQTKQQHRDDGPRTDRDALGADHDDRVAGRMAMPQLGGAVGQTPTTCRADCACSPGNGPNWPRLTRVASSPATTKTPAVMHRTTTDPVSPPPRACRSPTPKAATAAAMVPAVGAIALAV